MGWAKGNTGQVKWKYFLHCKTQSKHLENENMLLHIYGPKPEHFEYVWMEYTDIALWMQIIESGQQRAAQAIHNQSSRLVSKSNKSLLFSKQWQMHRYMWESSNARENNDA